MNIPDHFFVSLETVFRLKMLKFFVADPDLFDPGSEIRDGKIRIRDKHPGSATLVLGPEFFSSFFRSGSRRI
jgi:hypothetical protein